MSSVRLFQTEPKQVDKSFLVCDTDYPTVVSISVLAATNLKNVSVF